MMSTCSISKSEGRVVLFLSFDQGYFCPTGFLLPGKVFNEATDEASPPSLSGTRGSVEGKSVLCVCLIKLGVAIGEGSRYPNPTRISIPCNIRTSTL